MVKRNKKQPNLNKGVAMKNKSELQHEVDSLCLNEHLNTAGFTKEDLMDCLAEHYREEDKDSRPPLIPQYSVMLAQRAKHLESSKFDALLDNKSGLWIAEVKKDGIRAKLHLESPSNRIDSRHRSEITYEYVEKTNCLPHLRDMRHFIPGTVLDGELQMPVSRMKHGKTDTNDVLTSTLAAVNSLPGRSVELQMMFGYCSFFAFDILFYCGDDVRQLPYSKRYKILCSIHRSLIGYPFFRLPVQCEHNFIDFYHQIVKTGGEGIMLKRTDWPYQSHGRGRGWFKLAKGKETDAFITGFVPGEGEFSGLIGSLLVSTLVDGEPVEIGAVQPGHLPFRNRISLADGSLADNMYGKVVQVSYMHKTKNNRLRHAVLAEWRPDKTKYDCTERI